MISDMTAMKGRCGAVVHACNSANELAEVAHVVGSALPGKHVVGQVIYEGHLESKERFAIKRYLLIIGKKQNMQVL